MFIKLFRKIKNAAAKHSKKLTGKPRQEKFDVAEIKEPSNQQISTSSYSADEESTIKSVTKAPKKNKKASTNAVLNPNEQALFEVLKLLRQNKARQTGKQAYQVFHDDTLKEMVIKRPKNKAEMLRVHGIGEFKFAQYGEEFLDILTNKSAGLNPNEKILFERLKFLRRKLAKQSGKKAYHVFHDTALVDMISKMPSNKEEMLAVRGVGENKFSSYGEDFLELIANKKNESKSPDVLSGKAHYKYLIKSIEESQMRLVILSGWITGYVVDRSFLKLIEKKLKQGIEIYIGYGTRDHKGNHKQVGGGREALEDLQKLAKEYPSQLFIGSFATHIKLLIVDDQRIINGSANWLSNRNYVNLEFSLIVEDESVASIQADEYIKLIKENITG